MEHQVCQEIQFKVRSQINPDILSTLLETFGLTCYAFCFSPVQGGVDAKDLFHDYIMLWVEDMQLKLLDLCKMEKVKFSPLSPTPIEAKDGVN